MTEAQAAGDLKNIIQKFYLLVTGPDGSRRPHVDFAVYLKLNIRVSKTLMEDVDDWDEDDERDTARDRQTQTWDSYNLKITIKAY